MTEMMCEFCGGAATAIKFDVEIDHTETGDVERAIAQLICGRCAVEWYNGTERFPGTVAFPHLA